MTSFYALFWCELVFSKFFLFFMRFFRFICLICETTLFLSMIYQRIRLLLQLRKACYAFMIVVFIFYFLYQLFWRFNQPEILICLFLSSVFEDHEGNVTTLTYPDVYFKISCQLHYACINYIQNGVYSVCTALYF